MLLRIAVSAFVVISWSEAMAEEVKVLTAGAFKPVIAAVAREFEQAENVHVQIENDTAGALQKRIEGGERFDVLIAPVATLESLARTNKIQARSLAPLARAAIGVAVRKGAPMPDISSVEAFRQAIRQAHRVAYIDPASGGSSGAYLTRLFEQMGIADEVAGKAVLVPGGLVAQRLVTGEADLAIHQISEIIAVPGVELVGPLPEKIQKFTVYAGAMATGLEEGSRASRLLRYLGSERMAPVLREKGLQRP